MDKTLECPVFRPTLDEVRTLSFAEYVERIEPQFAEFGVCRIVAPEGWTPRRSGYNDLDHITLPKPIRQHATGRQGLYRTLLVEQRSLPLGDFRDLADDEFNRAPSDDPEVLERKFWRNIPMNPPLYGADIPGTLFDDRARGWSLKRLSSLLSQTLEANGAAIPGVTQPYLYVGSWRAFFAWHTEDMDLHSVNYLHHGAPKTWYVVPPAARERFELMASDLLPELSRSCPEFLRHKEIILSPALLAAHNIPVVKAVHNAREFIVVGPGAYHAGFNHGYNIAESVNFATKAWVPVGARAGFCTCHSDSVKIDMRLFLEYMDKDLRAEVLDSYSDGEDEYAEYYEEEEQEESDEESDDDEESEESESEEESEEQERSADSRGGTALGAPLRLPAKRVRRPSLKLLDSSPELAAAAQNNKKKTTTATRSKPSAATTKLSSRPKRTTKNSTTGRGTNKSNNQTSQKKKTVASTAVGIVTRTQQQAINHQRKPLGPKKQQATTSGKPTAANKPTVHHHTKRAASVDGTSSDDTRVSAGMHQHTGGDCCSRPSSKRTAARAWYQLFDTLLPALKRARA